MICDIMCCRAFDINSPSVNESQMEQFEIVIKRITSGGTKIADLGPGAVGARRRSISSGAPIVPAVSGVSPKPTKIRSLSAAAAVPAVAHGQTVHKSFMQQLVATNRAVCDAATSFVQMHKDLVLVLGLPGASKVARECLFCLTSAMSLYCMLCIVCVMHLVLVVWGLTLVKMCALPSLFSIFVFCCVTTFFGVHYSSIDPLESVDEGGSTVLLSQGQGGDPSLEASSGRSKKNV